MLELISTDQITESLNASISAGLSILAEQEPLTLSEHADKFFYLAPESSSIPGPWVTLPYQKDIMNVISNDDIKNVDLQKSARVGYTKIICAAINYFIEHKKRNIVLYQPTDDDARSFVKDEIDPMIRDVDILGALLKTEPDKKSRDNTTTKKSFIGSTLDILGGKTPRNYRRLTKDVVIYDELDGFDHDIGGEGSPLSLGDERITTSSFPKSIRGTTPKEKGTSQIEASIESAALVFLRFVPCPDCDHLHRFEWKNLVFEKDNPGSATFVCPECGVVITYDQYPEMDKAGRWQTLDGHFIDGDDFRAADGTVIETPEHVGFKIWAAYSYFTTWPQLVAEFLKAKDRMKQGDITLMKTFVNTKLGETWADEGEGVDDDDLYQRRDKYQEEFEVPAPVLMLTCAVDVQADRFEMEVVGWNSKQSYGIEFKIIYGDTLQDETWLELDDYLKKMFTSPAGGMKITCTAIDSGYRASTVYKFVKSRKARRIFAIKGVSGWGRPITTISRKRSGRSRRKVDLYNVGVDEVKSLIHSNLKLTDKNAAGYCHFPVSYDQEYFLQLTAEQLRTRYSKGHPVKEWHQTRPRNEALDIRCYNVAALDLMSPIWPALEKRHAKAIAEFTKEDNESTPAAKKAETEAPEKPARKKKKIVKKRRRGGGFVKRGM